MNIEEAKEGLNKDVYGLKNFLTDTEKEKWQEAIETVLNELEKYKQLINNKNARLNEYAEDIAKRDKVIDEMAEKLVEAHGWFYSEFDNYSKEDWKEYFYKRVGEENDAIGK